MSRSSSSIRSEGLLHPRATYYIRVQLRTYTRITLRKQAVNTLRQYIWTIRAFIQVYT